MRSNVYYILLATLAIALLSSIAALNLYNSSGFRSFKLINSSSYGNTTVEKFYGYFDLPNGTNYCINGSNGGSEYSSCVITRMANISLMLPYNGYVIINTSSEVNGQLANYTWVSVNANSMWYIGTTEASSRWGTLIPVLAGPFNMTLGDYNTSEYIPTSVNITYVGFSRQTPSTASYDVVYAANGSSAHNSVGYNNYTFGNYTLPIFVPASGEAVFNFSDLMVPNSTITTIEIIDTNSSFCYNSCRYPYIYTTFSPQYSQNFSTQTGFTSPALPVVRGMLYINMWWNGTLPPGYNNSQVNAGNVIVTYFRNGAESGNLTFPQNYST